LIFQTQIIWFNWVHSLKYLRSTTLGCEDIRIRKSEFVTNTQFFVQKENELMHMIICMPSQLAPDPIRVQSCVCCLFWTNRNSMAVTSIFLSHYSIRDMNPTIDALSKWTYLYSSTETIVEGQNGKFGLKKSIYFFLFKASYLNFTYWKIIQNFQKLKFLKMKCRICGSNMYHIPLF